MENILNGFFCKIAGEKKLRRRVEVFITDNRGRILAGRSPNGGFMFPGGGIDEGESINQAANREAMEEVGVSLQNIRAIGISPKDIPWERELQRWMNNKGVDHEGSRTYYRTAKIKEEDKSLYGRDGDSFKGEFFTKSEILDGLKKSLVGAKDKFKTFRDSDAEVLGSTVQSVSVFSNPKKLLAKMESRRKDSPATKARIKAEILENKLRDRLGQRKPGINVAPLLRGSTRRRSTAADLKLFGVREHVDGPRYYTIVKDGKPVGIEEHGEEVKKVIKTRWLR